MSENNENKLKEELAASSQPTPEIFSDATNRFLNNTESPTKTYSASQPEFGGGGGIMKKSRKSLGNGRRVSFAATAHVRVFGSEEKEAEIARQRAAAAEEEEEEQRQLELFRKQFEVDEIKNSLNEFEIKSSPVVSNLNVVNSIITTPSKRPFNTVDQSFDGKILVEVKFYPNSVF